MPSAIAAISSGSLRIASVSSSDSRSSGSIFEWLAHYNTAKHHTSLDCRTPDEHEAQY